MREVNESERLKLETQKSSRGEEEEQRIPDARVSTHCKAPKAAAPVAKETTEAETRIHMGAVAFCKYKKPWKIIKGGGREREEFARQFGEERKEDEHG